MVVLLTFSTVSSKKNYTCISNLIQKMNLKVSLYNCYQVRPSWLNIICILISLFCWNWLMYFCTKALKGHGDFQKKSHRWIVISNCAIRSHGLVIRYHGLVIRSVELDNSFSRIAIRSFELDIPRIRLSNSIFQKSSF